MYTQYIGIHIHSFSRTHGDVPVSGHAQWHLGWSSTHLLLPLFSQLISSLKSLTGFHLLFPSLEDFHRLLGHSETLFKNNISGTWGKCPCTFWNKRQKYSIMSPVQNYWRKQDYLPTKVEMESFRTYGSLLLN